MAALTEKQAEVFYFIKEYLEENGFPPTRQEAAEHFGVQPNAIQVRIQGLVKKGAVTTKGRSQRSTMPVKGFKVRIK